MVIKSNRYKPQFRNKRGAAPGPIRKNFWDERAKERDGQPCGRRPDPSIVSLTLDGEIIGLGKSQGYTRIESAYGAGFFFAPDTAGGAELVGVVEVQVFEIK